MSNMALIAGLDFIKSRQALIKALSECSDKDISEMEMVLISEMEMVLLEVKQERIRKKFSEGFYPVPASDLLENYRNGKTFDSIKVYHNLYPKFSISECRFVFEKHK